ncbi:hypothetical protein FA95DRAFT_1527543 [Auriscalpium vulgare]|uniref:Uncharacterized protein n=1 Tax=Auriscalpium vulgare TaxID=40419 RepID=A0ACB8R8V8_9AGAM|nr:hypothetical protein FA95DRAFT_1527543 [Auriscalpium vulgare]
MPSSQMALPPFANDPLADVAFRSCDGTIFLLSKHILSIASPVFADMFSLTRPVDPSAHEEMWEDRIPIVSVAEDSATLDLLLRWCYPIRPPRLKTLDDVRRLVAASQKYEVDAVVDAIDDALQAHLGRDPGGVFAVAVSYDLRKMATTAARSALALPLKAVISSVPASRVGDSLNVLIQYHINCGAAAAAVTVTARRDFFVLLPNFIAYNSGKCEQCFSLDPAYDMQDKRQSTAWYAPRSLWQFLHAAGQALLLNPHEAVIASYQVGQCRNHMDAECASSLRTQSAATFVEMLKREVTSAIEKVPIPSFT